MREYLDMWKQVGVYEGEIVNPVLFKSFSDAFSINHLVYKMSEKVKSPQEEAREDDVKFQKYYLNREKQRILSLEKLEPGFDYFFLYITWFLQLINKIVDSFSVNQLF